MGQLLNSRIDSLYVTWRGIWELQRAVECNGNILVLHTGKVSPSFICQIPVVGEYAEIFTLGREIFFPICCLTRIDHIVIKRVGWSWCGSKEQAPSRTTM